MQAALTENTTVFLANPLVVDSQMEISTWLLVHTGWGTYKLIPRNEIAVLQGRHISNL